jgi:FtsZ-interacting cell division protein ZipA
VTALLVVGGLVIVALGVAGVWLMERAAVEPAARASGEASDPAEENAVREREDGETAAGGGGVLEERPGA